MLLLPNALNKEKEQVTPGVKASCKPCTERPCQEEQCNNKDVPDLAELWQEHVFSTGSPRLPFVARPLEGQKYELFIAASVPFEIILSCLGASVDILIVYCTF